MKTKQVDVAHNHDCHTESRFNLIEEPWIQIENVGLVSLRQIFTQSGSSDYHQLGGNAVQKIAIMKLLLAIAQSANTPSNKQDWLTLGANGLADACLSYLENWHDAFYLYGEKPFLQMPAIKSAKVQSFGAVVPEVSTGNNIVLTQYNIEKSYSDADKAMILVQLMGFAFSGKKTDNSVVLSDGYREKTKSGKSGPSLGFLHSFLLGNNIQETLWFNLFQRDQLEDMTYYSEGLGVAPWEDMPIGESCPSAERLKSSLMGRLLPLSRFVLLTENGLHYSEGISHYGYEDGVVDPSVSVDFSAEKSKVLWVNPQEKPWRSLTALLSFMDNGSYDCYHIRFNLPRLHNQVKTIGIWSGGLRVSNQAGEQYVSGSDDYVDSVFFLNIMDDPDTNENESKKVGSFWYDNLKNEMKQLNALSKMVNTRVKGYFNTQEIQSKGVPKQAVNLFWQLCEPFFQDLIFACDDVSKTSLLLLHSSFWQIVNQVYDIFCPKGTARQIDAWAANKPNLRKKRKPSKKIS